MSAMQVLRAESMYGAEAAVLRFSLKRLVRQIIISVYMAIGALVVSSCATTGGGAAGAASSESTGEPAPSDEQVAEYRETIRKTVGSRMSEVQRCYHRAIEEMPMSEGRVVIKWAIDKDGKTLEHELVEAGPKIKHIYPCLVERLKSWQFPPTPGGMIVQIERYPFFFSENGKQPR